MTPSTSFSDIQAGRPQDAAASTCGRGAWLCLTAIGAGLVLSIMAGVALDGARPSGVAAASASNAR